MHSVQIVLVLVGLATVVAVFARKIAVPAPSLLVFAGLMLGFMPGVPDVAISPEIISLIVLPPLLYAAGDELSWPQLRRSWKPVSVLAIGLVPASAAAVAIVTVATTPVPWVLAFLLGAVLSSTDPVAVTALGRKLALPQRLQTLVQAESLFNDATSLILFRLSATVAVSMAVTWQSVVGDFVMLAAGGTLCGAVVATAVAALRYRTLDPVVESVITLVTPYLAYVLAEQIHVSGITAVVVSSVILGAVAPRITTSATRLQIHAVHATVVFVLESAVFALIGLQLPGLIRSQTVAGQPWLIPACLIVAALIVTRIAWIFPLAAFQHWRHIGADNRPMWQVPAVVSWAGARGVVPLAAALSIPEGLPYRDLLILLAVGVTVVSLIVQGFTLGPLVRRVRLAVPREDSAGEYRLAWQRLVAAGESHLDDLTDLEAAAPVLIERARHSLRGRDLASAHLAEPYALLRRDLLRLQQRELATLHQEGKVAETTMRRIQRELDLDAERFADPH